MKTVKEISEFIQTKTEPGMWLDELSTDARIGVQTAITRWKRNYEKRIVARQEFDAKCQFDQSFAPFNGALVAGVDEAGRGPLAGPVVCAAVILPENPTELIGLTDSKALSRAKREELAQIIKDVAISTSIHIQDVHLIDELNIFEATKRSMETAVGQLTKKPDFIILDAMKISTKIPFASVVKADAQSLAVAAASILAKTERDAIMRKLHEEFPHYNFAGNAGYGTTEHVLAIEQYGPCCHHRKSFEPVKSLLEQRR